MLGIIKTYLITFGIFMAIDMVWLGIIARNIYQKYLGNLMKTQVNWVAGIGFYLLFIIGLIFFVIDPALSKQSIKYAVFAGAFFGFITYATYDLTNLATLKDWPVMITVIDLLWGSVICSVTSLLSYLLLSR